MILKYIEPTSCPRYLDFLFLSAKFRGHGGPCSKLLQTREEVEEAIQLQVDLGIPPDHLMVVEYAGEPIRDQVFRKQAMFRVGPALTSSPCVHDGQWLVKTGFGFIADMDLYEADSQNVKNNLDEEALRKRFDLAEIEYGRADFGFYKGRLQVFEINTNPHLLPPKAHTCLLQMETNDLAWRRLLMALNAVDAPAGADIRLPKHSLLNRHRRWHRFLHRSRPVS